MSNKKISQLPESLSLNATDLLPIVTDNTTKKITGQTLLEFTNQTLGSLSGDWDSASTVVRTVSSYWNSVFTKVNEASANWDSSYSVLNNSSSFWNSSYFTINALSANWDSVYSNVRSNSSSYVTTDSAGNVGIGTTTPNATLTVVGNISATGAMKSANGTFTSSVSAPALSGTFYGDGSLLTGVVHTSYVPPTNATFTSSVSAPALSGTHYGDGSNLSGVIKTQYTLLTASNTVLGGVKVDGSSITISNGVISASAYSPPANATFTSSVSAPALSGTFYGDGSLLTGVIHTSYSPPANATFTSSVSAPALSGTFYGDGSLLTGVIHTSYNPPANATFTSSVSAPALSGTFYGDGSNLTGVVTTYTLTTASNTVLGGVKVDGSSITISNGVISASAYNLPANATFTSSVSAPALSGTFYGDGSKLIGVGTTYTLTTASNTVLGGVKVDGSSITISNGVISASAYNPPANATFTSSVSAPALSGTFYGDGSNLTGVVKTQYSLPQASTTTVGGIKIDGSTLAFNGSNQLYYTGAGAGGYSLPTATTGTLGGVKVDGTSITINNGVISASAYNPPANATFTSSVSAPALSGTFYGDGSKLTGVQYTPPANATFTSSVSAPALSGVHYGDGTALTGVIHTQYTPPANATFTSSVSAPALSGVHYGDGSRLTNVPFSIPQASTSVVGGVKVDGDTLAFNNFNQLYYTGTGVGGYSLPTATTGTLGGVMVDGTSITINNGVISASAYNPPADATFTSSVSAPSLSGVHYGDGSKLTGVQYTPPANATFTSSVSAPALSGVFYGDGSKLTGIAAGGTTNALTLSSSAYIMAVPGDNLITKYASLTAFTPNGAARSATNRAVLLLYPGKYDLGTDMLNVSAEYIDVVGITQEAVNVFITSSNSSATLCTSAANNVFIKGVTLDNTGSGSSYVPGISTATLTKVTNVTFNTTMKGGAGIYYAGTYTNCVGGDYSFGTSGTASGTFTNCVASSYSFGGSPGGTASGTFTNCVASSYSFGNVGTASGTFTNCSAGTFSYGFQGVASGTFMNCSGAGSCYGYLGTASGTFTNCTVNGDYGFGGNASGTFTNCTGANRVFATLGTASGTFNNCTGGYLAFAGQGTASGKFINCTCTFTNGGSFGGAAAQTGKFINCFMPTIPTLTTGGRIVNCFDTLSYNLYNGSA